MGSVLLILVLSLYFIFSSGGSKYNWSENYLSSNDQPFGLEHTLDYLEAIYDDGDIIIPDSSITKTLEIWKDSIQSNYVHIGGYLPINEEARDEFFEYVSAGNSALLILKKIPESITDYVNDGECTYVWQGFSSVSDTVCRVNFNHPNLRKEESFVFQTGNRYGTLRKSWNHFGEIICPDNYSFTPIGTLNDTLVNLVRVEYGDGFIYLHSNPLLFTNYFVVQEEGANYIRDVFSHLNTGPIVYEDRRYKGDFFGGESGSRDYNSRSEGPFKYLLTQESFRWAIYTLLGLLALYIFFGIRRKQSPIPVQRLPENSSIEYVETISELYYQSKGKEKIAEYLFSQYYDFIRSKYQLMKGDNQEKFLKKLSLKSEVGTNHLKQIEEMDSLREHKIEMTQEDLINYYQKLEQFYENCK